MRRGELERSIALDAAKGDIAKRIRKVCADFSELEFDELVDHMAEIDVRYRLRDCNLLFDGTGLGAASLR